MWRGEEQIACMTFQNLELPGKAKLQICDPFNDSFKFLPTTEVTGTDFLHDASQRFAEVVIATFGGDAEALESQETPLDRGECNSLPPKGSLLKWGSSSSILVPQHECSGRSPP